MQIHGWFGWQISGEKSWPSPVCLQVDSLQSSMTLVVRSQVWWRRVVFEQGGDFGSILSSFGESQSGQATWESSADFTQLKTPRLNKYQGNPSAKCVQKIWMKHENTNQNCSSERMTPWWPTHRHKDDSESSCCLASSGDLQSPAVWGEYFNPLRPNTTRGY